ncbi:hypothetical protein WDU94_007920 [Cyamophila willieti]
MGFMVILYKTISCLIPLVIVVACIYYINQIPNVLKGPKGDTGDQGLKGEKGDPGRDGINGAKGEPGLPGSIGPQGPTGDKGARGSPGILQPYVILHSLTSEEPQCTTSTELKRGYSLFVTKDDRDDYLYEPDLGNEMSCVAGEERKELLKPCSSSKCEQYYWLGTKDQPARCVKCKLDTSIYVKHGPKSGKQPECDVGYTRLWDGYSVYRYTNAYESHDDVEVITSQTLDPKSTGTCLKEQKPKTHCDQNEGRSSFYEFWYGKSNCRRQLNLKSADTKCRVCIKI